MDEDILACIEEVAGSHLASRGLIIALITVLQAKGVLSQSDINNMLDQALLGAENASHNLPELRRISRQSLEQTQRTLGGPLARERR